MPTKIMIFRTFSSAFTADAPPLRLALTCNAASQPAPANGATVLKLSRATRN